MHANPITGGDGRIIEILYDVPPGNEEVKVVPDSTCPEHVELGLGRSLRHQLNGPVYVYYQPSGHYCIIERDIDGTVTASVYSLDTEADTFVKYGENLVEEHPNGYLIVHV